MRRPIACFVFLAACGMADRGYTLDGVPVVLEKNKGPKVEHLSHAAQTYRDAARERWELTTKQDRVAWRGLREIRWTDRTVVDRASYDPQTAIISANWIECALDVPFFEALTEHYAGEGLTDEDLAWAEELREESSGAVCIGDVGNGLLPW